MLLEGYLMNSDKKNSTPRRGQFSAVVQHREQFGAEYQAITVALTGQAVAVFAKARPGQFVQLACRDLKETRNCTPLLRRPFSIAAINNLDNASGTELQVIYKVLGPGSKWLQQRTAGDAIDIIGPLGNGFTLPENKQDYIIMIGGGVGLPPMFFLSDELARQGYQNHITIAGAQNGHYFEGLIQPEAKIDNTPTLTMAIERFSRNQTGCIITTDDGSLGFNGNVVVALNNFLDQQQPWQKATIYACGPGPMLKAIAGLVQKRQMNCQVCMEAYMSCGIGLCQSCAVPTNSGNKYKLVCTNGPVFDSKTIAWDEI
jgi:dihydroorotate dehydrogenase electron transfer subunit